MSMSSRQRVIILGGYGTFGSLISDELIHSADVVIAGRNQAKGQRFADSIGADFSLCDVKDNKSLRATIKGAFVVVNTSGPFLPNDYSVPEICLEENCHYIDLADNRDYVTSFPQLHELAKNRKVFACTGASTTPAVTFALLSKLHDELKQIHSIQIYLTAGNKNQAGASTFESILSYTGIPVRIWEQGQWQSVTGWGLNEYFRFPDPVGKRIVQVCDVPDLELFPPLFGADQVVFKAGLELSIFNIGLLILAQLKRQIPRINLTALAKPLIRISRLFKNFGSYAGSVLVKLEDKKGKSKSLAFIASQNGPRLPTAPAILLTRKILQTGPPSHGAFPCIRFISMNEFRNYLEPFGIKMISS